MPVSLSEPDFRALVLIEPVLDKRIQKDSVSSTRSIFTSVGAVRAVTLTVTAKFTSNTICVMVAQLYFLVDLLDGTLK